MRPATDSNPARRRRLIEELEESGVELGGTEEWRTILLDEVDYALRPHVHERRVATFGAIVMPRSLPIGWQAATQLHVTRRPIGEMPLSGARLFADGISSWLIRRLAGHDEWAVFDRPAASERDLVVLAEGFDGTIVQRHPTGVVRVVGELGVLRWDGLGWHREPPVSSWIDTVAACPQHGDREVLQTLLEFAVHDLGGRGIGAILVYQPDDHSSTSVQERLPAPPPLQITHPADLAPFRHVLAQVDGAAVLDASGTLRQLGVRLVPSSDAESSVEGYRGMRHTAGRRYSFDDPAATVVVVSEDGPVTVLRNGELLGRSTSTGIAE